MVFIFYLRITSRGNPCSPARESDRIDEYIFPTDIVQNVCSVRFISDIKMPIAPCGHEAFFIAILLRIFMVMRVAVFLY